MRFKPLLFAAASLLALANAAASPKAEISPSVLVDASTLIARAPHPADHYCHQPWLECFNDYGGGDACSHYCNCQYFHNPHLFRRHAGEYCVV
jgi:hypothetical protein